METVRARDLPELNARLAEAPRVAIDTEFHAERRWMPKLYLVQLHLEGAGTWLVDPLAQGHLEALAASLRSRPWIVHGGQQDLRLLARALGGVSEQVLDTQIAAAFVGQTWPAPYGQLVSTWLGQRLDKDATLSDWSRRPLTPRQLDYAAEDVRLLPPLWDRLAAAAADRGREELVPLACDDARREAIDPPTPELLWRSIQAAHILEPHEAAVLQELCAWREDVARAQDLPAWSVLGDGVLFDLARRRPSTVDTLAANRRLPKGLVRDHGEALVERIQRASRRPEWAWPRPVSPTSAAGRVARWLRCWAFAVGHERTWAADHVLPEELAEDLAADPPATRHLLAVALGAWRDTLIGDDLWTALSGGVALHAAGDVVISPIRG